VTEAVRWQPATAFTDPVGVLRSGLLARPQREWGAAAHTAAALAWKAYCWWLVSPAVQACAEGRAVLDLRADNVEVALHAEHPYVEFRVLDDTPLPGPDALPGLRATLLDAHLAPVIDALVRATRIGRRTLWGSVADTAAQPLLQRADPAGAARLLERLGLDDLLTITGDTCAVRRTCCQAVVVAGLGICDTCPVQRRRAAPALAG
jgi:ferric iron reductase protein FhuF